MLGSFLHKTGKFGFLLVIILIILSFAQSNFLVDYSGLIKVSLLSLVATYFFLFKNSKDKIDQTNVSFFQKPSIYIILFSILYVLGSSIAYNPFDGFYKTLPFIISIIIIFQLRKKISVDLFYIISGIVLGLITLILSSYTIIGLIIEKEYTHQLTYFFRYSFGHRNMYSNFTLLTIPVILTSYFYQSNKKLKLYLLIVSIINVSCVLFLMTRSSYLALAIFILFITTTLSIRASIQKKIINKKGIIILGSLVFGLIISLLLFNKSIQLKLENLFSSSYGRLSSILPPIWVQFIL